MGATPSSQKHRVFRGYFRVISVGFPAIFRRQGGCPPCYLYMEGLKETNNERLFFFENVRIDNLVIFLKL